MLVILFTQLFLGVLCLLVGLGKTQNVKKTAISNYLSSSTKDFLMVDLVKQFDVYECKVTHESQPITTIGAPTIKATLFGFEQPSENIYGGNTPQKDIKFFTIKSGKDDPANPYFYENKNPEEAPI